VKIKKLALVAAGVAFAFGTTVQAQSWGLWEADRSWVGFGDGESTDWYSLWDDGVGTFDTADLGSFQMGANYQLWNWDIKTWGANAAGAALHVTIYEQGNRPAEPVFEEWWQTNDEVIAGDDRVWRGYVDGGTQGGDAFQVNILDGLDVGNYSIEVYARAWGTDPDDVWDSNAGNNFVGTFEVVPEPGTMGLLVLGLLGVAGLRRRIKCR